MEKVRIHILNPQKRSMDAILDVLNRGGIVLLPGDTSYLLAIKIGKKNALEKLDRLKQSVKRKFYSVMFKDMSELAKYTEITDKQFSILKSSLPGPYTFILKANRQIPKIMLENRKEIGIRIPDSPFIKTLLEECGEPLIVSTANTDSSENFFQDPETDEPEWLHLVDLVADGGFVQAGLTTIIRLENNEYEIVRVGQGSVERFE